MRDDHSRSTGLRGWRSVLGLAAALVLGGLAGCTSTLVDYSVPAVHVVQPGETLYAIAWRHGVDYHALARWNGLDNPDLLMVGQRLRLRPGTELPAARPSPPPPASAPPASRPPAEPPPVAASAPAVRWSWPTRGPLLRRFGDRSGLSNGIGIGGAAGQAIRAAAGGRVVYAGSGLAAYGQLVIINHDDRFLSAYGYNERLFVAQGDEVDAGQLIAHMGNGPEHRPQLHFEIRRNGSPVDPLSFLPPL